MSGIRSHALKLILLAIVVVGANAAHAAKLYKWSDEAGNIHYSQNPPANKDSEEVISGSAADIEPASPVDTTSIEIQPPADPEASQRLADRCQQLYHDLKLYVGAGGDESESPLKDDEGNALVISVEMREAKIAEIKAELDASCR
jgi:hypothetical protein